jgi:hypothetical protein
MSCNYQGYEFGASYLDSVCIDGMLWDADSGFGTDEGWIYDHGGEDPCPLCNRKGAVSNLAQRIWEDAVCKGRDAPGAKGELKTRRNRKWFYNEARRRINRYLISAGYERQVTA